MRDGLPGPSLATDDRGRLGAFMVLVGGAVALVVLTITLLLGVALVGGVTDGLGGSLEPINKTAEPDPLTDEAVQFEDTRGEAEITQVFSVRDSQGYGIELTGADDSFVESDGEFAIASDSEWTISTWASVDESAAGETMTALSADGRVLIQYNGSVGEWSAWYYDDASRDSYRVSVDAPTPHDLTWVGAHHDGEELTIYRNETQGESVATNSSSIETAGTESANWNGQLDETRTFDDALDSTQRNALVTDPVAPLPDANRTARLMYDQGEGDSTPIYFAGTSATLSNHTWVDGHDGTDLESDVDYTLDASAGTITALSDGRIDGAPVVFLDYEFSDRSAVNDLGLTLAGSFELFASSVLVVPAAAVLAVLIAGLVGAVRYRGSITGSSDRSTEMRKRR